MNKTDSESTYPEYTTPFVLWHYMVYAHFSPSFLVYVSINKMYAFHFSSIIARNP